MLILSCSFANAFKVGKVMEMRRLGLVALLILVQVINFVVSYNLVRE